MTDYETRPTVGSPLAWIIVLIVAAFLALGVWWILNSETLSPAETGDTDITIEQEAPDVDIVIPEGSDETTG